MNKAQFNRLKLKPKRMKTIIIIQVDFNNILKLFNFLTHFIILKLKKSKKSSILHTYLWISRQIHYVKDIEFCLFQRLHFQKMKLT